MDSVRRSRRAAFITVLALLTCSGAYLGFVALNKPVPPPIVVVSPCKSPSPSMHRVQVGDRYSFFATANEFSCREQMDDTPPFTERFCLKPKRGGPALVFSIRDSNGFYGAPSDPMLVFSEYSEKRNVVDATGRVIGQDSWGYWDRDKFWRKVHLLGINAKYGPVTKSEAKDYDQILSSACFSNP
jgi:hypothetical protein